MLVVKKGKICAKSSIISVVENPVTLFLVSSTADPLVLRGILRKEASTDEHGVLSARRVMDE